MITERNFKNWIVLLPVMGVLFTSVLLTYLYMQKLQSHYKNELQIITENKTNLIKSEIKNRVDIICELLDQNFQIDDHQYSDIIFKKNQNILNNTLFNENHYIFAYDFKGNTIAHMNKELIGKNRLNSNINGRYLIKEAIEHPQLKKGFFMSYKASYNPQENQSKEKISYVKSPKYTDWVIGTGIYMDTFNGEIVAVKKRLNKEFKETLNMVIYISVLVTLIGIVIMSYLSQSIFMIFKRYQKRLLEQNFELENKVEQRVAEQNSIMRLFDNAETILYKWEYKNRRFKYISKNIVNILGYKKEQIVNKSFIYTKYIHHADVDEYVNESKDAVQNAKHYFEHKPYRIVSKDGSIKWIREYKLLILNKKGKINYVIGYITDITHLKEQEQLAIDSNKTVALKNLIGNLAHQWRQPLSVISTAASGMRLQNEMNLLNAELIEEYNKNIVEHCQYLSKTLDSFKNLSETENSKSYITMKSIMDKLLGLLKADIQESKVEIILNIHEHQAFYSNEQHLLELMMHLLNNAMDALGQINGEKLVLIDICVKSQELCISIKDSAGGISDEIMQKLFEPYFTTKHQSLGTGLGLPIVQNIVHALEGTLQLKNQTFVYENMKLKGVEVSICIPLK